MGSLRIIYGCLCFLQSCYPKGRPDNLHCLTVHQQYCIRVCYHTRIMTIPDEVDIIVAGGMRALTIA
jgi:hypothetical protein